MIVNTLVYDGRLEVVRYWDTIDYLLSFYYFHYTIITIPIYTSISQVQSSVLLLTGQSTAKRMYKVSKAMDPPDFLTEIPCGVCPLIAQCSEGFSLPLEKHSLFSTTVVVTYYTSCSIFIRCGDFSNQLRVPHSLVGYAPRRYRDG